MEKIRPIQRTSVGEQISDQFKEFLIEGRWKPGDKIPSESELAEAFGVSRVTVREAILRVTALGLFESRFGGGTYVKEIDPGIYMNAVIPVAYLDTNSVLDVIEYRQVVEVKTAGLAARRANEQNIEDLESILLRMTKVKNDVEKFAEEDLNFHLEIAKITKNSLLIATMNVIKSALRAAMFRSIQYRGNEKGIAYHRRLIDSMKQHDEKETMRIMEEHIDDVYATMEKDLRKLEEESKDLAKCE
ncbi:FadR/GntR family transcriptional regulator [Oscillospiraceae bacterium PP1C4]